MSIYGNISGGNVSESLSTQLEYCGKFTTELPTTVTIDGITRPIRKGDYVIADLVATISGITYAENDWAVYNGSGWDKVKGSETDNIGNDISTTYATKSEVDNLSYINLDDAPTTIGFFMNDSGYITSETDPTVPAWAKEDNKPTYTKSEVGLANVDNTSDINKPVSTAQQTALNSKLSIDGTAAKATADAEGNVITTTYATKSELTTKQPVGDYALLIDGMIPAAQLPSYVDDVVEGYLHNGEFYEENTYQTQIQHESGKVYIDVSTNLTYRWGGSAYASISSSIALGETESTAYRGDRGKIAFDHSQTLHSPSNAERNIIVSVKKEGNALTPDENRAINIVETDPTVPNWAKEITKPSYSKSEVGLGNVDNVKQYSASNPPPYPVTSVNGQTGAITGVATTSQLANYLPLTGGAISGDLTVQGLTKVNGKPINDSKTFSGLYASANNTANACFYIGSVKADDYYKTSHIKYQISASIPGQTNYSGFFIIDYFFTQSSIQAYACFNDHNSTSYRTLYYHDVCFAKKAGYDAGYGHLIGIDLYNATNPTSSTYPRTFKIDILELDNCSFNFLDTAVILANVPNYNTTYYNSSPSLYTGASNGLQESSDNDSYYRLMAYNRVTTGNLGMFSYSLFAEANDGKYYPFTTTGGTGTSKVACDKKFSIGKPVLFYSSSTTLAANATSGDVLYKAYHAVDLRYTGNLTSTQYTQYQSVYLDITIDTDTQTYTPTNTLTTQTLEAGHYYIYLGEMYSTSKYQLCLYAENPIFYYDGTKLIPYEIKLINDIYIPTALSEFTDDLGDTPVHKHKNLKVTTLNSGDDLDNMTADGYYMTVSTAVCNSLLHKPNNMPAGELRLEVYQLGSASYLIQKLMAKAGTTIKEYFRIRSANAYGSWRTYATPDINNDINIENSGNVTPRVTDTKTIGTDTKRFNTAHITTIYENGASLANKYANINHDHTFESLTNKPATLSGYGITDAIPKSGGTMSGTAGIEIPFSSTASLNLGSYRNNLAASPVDKYLWHDLFAFLRNYTCVYETTADGTTWTTSDVNKNLFAQKEAQNINIISATGKCGSRWTFDNVYWSSGLYVLIGHSYSATPATVTVKIELSNTDGTTWSTVHESTNSINASPALYALSSGIANNKLIRISITKDVDDTTKSSNISCIKLLTLRWGDQGSGSEIEVPYAWDCDRNITLPGNATIGGNLIVNGSTTSINVQTVSTEDCIIELASGRSATQGITTPAGIEVKNYKGTEKTGQLVFKNDGYAYVGDSDDLKPLTTREGLIDNNLTKWDATLSSIVDGGLKIGEQYFVDSVAKGEVFNDYTNNIASGERSHAEGYYAISSGEGAHAEGGNTIAIGDYSHVEGVGTVAYGIVSHAEGASGEFLRRTITSAVNNSTIIPVSNIDVGYKFSSFAVVSIGEISDKNGYRKVVAIDSINNTITVDNPITANANTYIYRVSIAYGNYSHAEGGGTAANEDYSHAEGMMTIANGPGTHVEGGNTLAVGEAAHAEGFFTTAYGNYSHSEGEGTWLDTDNLTIGADVSNSSTITLSSFSINDNDIGTPLVINGKIYIITSYNTTNQTVTLNAPVTASVGTPIGTVLGIAYGETSYSGGSKTRAMGKYSHAEGCLTTAMADASHAEGSLTAARGKSSHAEGSLTLASGVNSHTEGMETQATGETSHAEGGSTTASGNYSHAEGGSTTASGDYSHAQNLQTRASGEAQTVIGKYNVDDTTSALIIGNGINSDTLSNALTVGFDGVARFVSTGGLGYIGNDFKLALPSISSNGTLVATNASQSIDGKTKFTTGLVVSGRYYSGGDDEGIVIEKAANNYAGLCLGDKSGIRSVFYLNPSNQALWRFNNGTTYDIFHPAKSGTIALTSDINNGTLTIQKNGTSVGTFTSNQSGNITANITIASADVTDRINNTSTGVCGFGSQATSDKLITRNTLVYWNGAYEGTNSNLAYCSTNLYMGGAMHLHYNSTNETLEFVF